MSVKLQIYLAEITGIIICVGLGVASGLITDPTTAWFQQLAKPPLYPPAWAFPTVWTTLYALMGIAAGKIYKNRDRLLMRWFIIQFIFNMLWTPLFFYFQQVGLALLDMSLLGMSLYYCLQLAKNKQHTVYYLLLPYFLWLCFAFYLNASIYIMN